MSKFVYVHSQVWLTTTIQQATDVSQCALWRSTGVSLLDGVDSFNQDNWFSNQKQAHEYTQ